MDMNQRCSTDFELVSFYFCAVHEFTLIETWKIAQIKLQLK